VKKTRILRSTKPWYVMRMEGIFFFLSATNLRLQLFAIEEVLGVKCMKANVDCCWQIKNGRKTRSSREELFLLLMLLLVRCWLADCLACLPSSAMNEQNRLLHL